MANRTPTKSPDQCSKVGNSTPFHQGVEKVSDSTPLWNFNSLPRKDLEYSTIRFPPLYTRKVYRVQEIAGGMPKVSTFGDGNSGTENCRSEHCWSSWTYRQDDGGEYRYWRKCFTCQLEAWI